MSGILQRYSQYFDFPDDFTFVSLNEGNTPLIEAPKVAQETGVSGISVFLKFEGLNPTGSFKDRGMTYAVSRAKYEGAKYIICASTGNTSASAAAYGARSGTLKTLIVLPQGKVALGKLSQAVLHGAKIIEIEGNFDQALDIVRAVGQSQGVAIVNSINPYRIEGQKTGAFEVCDVLGDAPDYHFIPVGNAGNITAYWLGYQQYFERGRIKKHPKMFGYEAEGSAAIVKGVKIDNPETLATAIRIGNPASWKQAEQARDESSGRIDSVTDEEIVAAWKFLASDVGVFCEPASAASVAGLLKAAKQGLVQPNSVVTCVLTGHGLKDPDNAIKLGGADKVTLPADVQKVAGYLGL